MPAAAARAGSLALSTSGTLPLLPELVSSDRPLSTPNNLNCPFFSACSGSILGSCGPRLGPPTLPRDKRYSLESPLSNVRYRLLPLLESVSGSAGDRESPGGEMACVLGLYREPRQLSLDTGEPCREPSDTTDSRSEKVLSMPERDCWPGEGPDVTALGGEGDLLGPPVVATPRLGPTYGGVKHRSVSFSILPRSF